MITIRRVVCDREPYFVRDTATALDAAEYMAGRNIGAVCVLDDADKLCGIFSERDLLNRVVVRKLDPGAVPIRNVMSELRAVIDCADTPHEALERMERVGTGRPPVVEGDKFGRMRSIRDMMRVKMSGQGTEPQVPHENTSRSKAVGTMKYPVV